MRYLISLAVSCVVVFFLFPGNEQAHHAGSPGADGAGGRHHDRLHPPQASGDLARETTGTAQTAAPEPPAAPPEMEVASTDRPKMDSSPMDMPKLDIPVNIGGGNALGAYSTGGGGGGMGATTAPSRWRPSSHDAPQGGLAGLASGKVLVEFTVTERGTVSNIRIVRKSPAAMTSARRRAETIAKWTFKPAMVDGKPQAVACSKRSSLRPTKEGGDEKLHTLILAPVAMAVLLSTATWAAEQPALSDRAYRAVNKAQALITEKKYGEANAEAAGGAVRRWRAGP